MHSASWAQQASGPLASRADRRLQSVSLACAPPFAETTSSAGRRSRPGPAPHVSATAARMTRVAGLSSHSPAASWPGARRQLAVPPRALALSCLHPSPPPSPAQRAPSTAPPCFAAFRMTPVRPSAPLKSWRAQQSLGRLTVRVWRRFDLPQKRSGSRLRRDTTSRGLISPAEGHVRPVLAANSFSNHPMHEGGA